VSEEPKRGVEEPQGHGRGRFDPDLDGRKKEDQEKGGLGVGTAGPWRTDRPRKNGSQHRKKNNPTNPKKSPRGEDSCQREKAPIGETLRERNLGGARESRERRRKLTRREEFQ